jgi:ribosomal protein S18 acetylase RimI-like enzyme
MNVLQPVVKENLISYEPQAASARCVRELCEQDFAAVIRLLDEDPMRAVHLRGLVEDYGVCNAALRGRLFGYYEDDHLANIALLGHHTLIYKEREGLKEFAEKFIETNVGGNLILGPLEQVEEFWCHLKRHGRETRLVSPQFWYVCRKPLLATDAIQLTLATLDQLDEIVPVQAHLVYEQSGRDPRVTDPEGFRSRVRERILRQRTWVKTQEGRVIFKAELVCESPDAVYLESIWTRPNQRGTGIATTCVTELVNRFLFKKKAVCILVDPEEEAAQRIYRRVGFAHEADYQARFLASAE